MTTSKEKAVAPVSGAKLVFDDLAAFMHVVGQQSAHLRLIEEKLGVSAGVRGNEIALAGEETEVALASKLIEELYGLARRGVSLYEADVDRAVRVLKTDSTTRLADIFLDTVFVASRSRLIAPK